MIGWILCLIGRHEWWERSTWPPLPSGNYGEMWAPVKAASLSELIRMRARRDLDGCTAVCGRCPAKRYA